jgi:hypothetical protein
MSKIVMVSLLSSHIVKYAVSIPDDAKDSDALKYIIDVLEHGTDGRDICEFSQEWLGLDPTIAKTAEITEEEYLEQFDRENDYLSEKPLWFKMEFLNHMVRE